MALKNLFDMVKADRYTADGREALIKAQEAETEDATRRTYQIGEISQSTGLQKTANGWVKPKNGAGRNHGTEQKKRGPGAIHTPGKGSVGMDKMKEAAEKGLKGQELKEFMTGAKSEPGPDPQTYIVKKNDELRKMYLNEKDPAKKEAMKKALKKQASMMEPEPFSSTESKPQSVSPINKEKLLDSLSFDLVDTTADIEEEYNAVEHSDNSRLPEFVRQQVENEYVNKTNGEKWSDAEKDIIAEEVTRRIKERQSNDSAPSLSEIVDRVYNIGEISEKTGLQKTAQGWRKVKKGAAGSKTGEGKSPSAGSINRTPERIKKETAIMEALNLSTGEDNNLHKMSDETIERLYKKAMSDTPAPKKENPTRTFTFNAGPDGKPVPGTGKQVQTFKTKEEAQKALNTQNAAAKYKNLPGPQRKDALFASTFEGISIGQTQNQMERQGWDLIKADDQVNVYGKPDGSKVTMKHDGKNITETNYEAPAAGSESKPAGKLPKGVTKVRPISPQDKLDYGKSHYLDPNSEETKQADEIVNKWFESEGKEIMPDLYLVNENGEARAFSTRAGLVNKLAYMIKNDKPYDLTYISRKDATAKDSAPRVLTGDCRIRIRKEKPALTGDTKIRVRK